MLCKSCGKEIANENLFCPNCGFKNENVVDIEKSTASEENQTTEKPVWQSSTVITSNIGLPHSQNEIYQTSGSQLPPPGPQIPTNGVLPPPRVAQSGMNPIPPAYQSGTNPLPPPIHGYGSVYTNKKNKLLIPFVAVGVAFALLIVILAILIFSRAFKKDYYPGDYGNNTNLGSNQSSTGNISTNQTPSEIGTDDSGVSENGATSSGTENIYDYKYSYAELPDVLSLDSDTRFYYVNYYTENDIYVYTYQFMETNATYSEFLKACEDYSKLLQNLNSFIYEKEISEEQFQKTGEPANYLTRDNYGIAITVSQESTAYYAYVSIFTVSDNTPPEDSEEVYNLPNYDTYLANRESKKFTYEETFNMENGLSAYIYDVKANYPGDGTMTIDVIMDLSSYYSDYYFNNGDFMILPFDSEGNVLSDAVPITFITDAVGYDVAMPFLLSPSSYEYYTLTYQVPSNTVSFSIYGANVYNNQFSGPVYQMDIGFE